MRVDFRDKRYIWNAATVVEIEKSIDYNIVTVSYDGWGEEWDEKISWHHERLAKNFRYTREVKCLVGLPLQKSNKNTFWPCKVQFRMPHPGHNQACEDLRFEMSIFVIPYGSSVPKEFDMKQDGSWIQASRVSIRF